MFMQANCRKLLLSSLVPEMESFLDMGTEMFRILRIIARLVFTACPEQICLDIEVSGTDLTQEDDCELLFIFGQSPSR